MPSIVTDSSFTSITSYPEIAADYTYTLKAMKNISFDIWVASHASQFFLHKKRKPGDAYNPAVFKDIAGYEAALNELQKDFDEKMKQQ
jgi:metallo-beta-lactamase class B